MSEDKEIERGIKFCPMLTGTKEVQGLGVGKGNCVKPVLNKCLQEHCAAFEKRGYWDLHCKHYHTKVNLDVEVSDEGE